MKEAEKILKENELKLHLETEEELDKETIIIKEQTPKPGIKIKKGNEVYVEY